MQETESSEQNNWGQVPVLIFKLLGTGQKILIIKSFLVYTNKHIQKNRRSAKKMIEILDKYINA